MIHPAAQGLAASRPACRSGWKFGRPVALGVELGGLVCALCSRGSGASTSAGVCRKCRARSQDWDLRLLVQWLLPCTVAAPRQRSGWPHQPDGAPVLLIPNRVWSQNVDRPTPLGMFVFDERQLRAEMISCATHSCVLFFNTRFYQGLICGRIAALVAWEPASLLARWFLLRLHGGEGTAGDE